MALPLKATLPPQTITAEEFETRPEFWEGYELIDGRLVKKPMPGYEHNWAANKINLSIAAFDPKMKLGTMLPETLSRLGPYNVPQPDLAYWKAANRPKKLIKGAGPLPDLVVEVLSPHDLETKKRLSEAYDKIKRYQEAGVGLIWLVNPKSQTVEVYNSSQPQPMKILTITDQLDGADVIPGFELAIKELFEYPFEDNDTDSSIAK